MDMIHHNGTVRITHVGPLKQAWHQTLGNHQPQYDHIELLNVYLSPQCSNPYRDVPDYEKASIPKIDFIRDVLMSTPTGCTVVFHESTLMNEKLDYFITIAHQYAQGPVYITVNPAHVKSGNIDNLFRMVDHQYLDGVFVLYQDSSSYSPAFNSLWNTLNSYIHDEVKRHNKTISKKHYLGLWIDDKSRDNGFTKEQLEFIDSHIFVTETDRPLNNDDSIVNQLFLKYTLNTKDNIWRSVWWDDEKDMMELCASFTAKKYPTTNVRTLK